MFLFTWKLEENSESYLYLKATFVLKIEIPILKLFRFISGSMQKNIFQTRIYKMNCWIYCVIRTSGGFRLSQHYDWEIIVKINELIILFRAF